MSQVSQVSQTSQIERLLELLQKHPDGELRIETDQPIQLDRLSGAAPVTRAPVTVEQWRSILLQIVPPFALAVFEQEGALETVLSLGSRSLGISLQRTPTGGSVALIRQHGPALDTSSLPRATQDTPSGEMPVAPG